MKESAGKALGIKRRCPSSKAGGLVAYREEADLAALSTFSSPEIPSWKGTQVRVIFGKVESALWIRLTRGYVELSV